jgi:2-amino-4-hydroxy-6-hydroxymethyldihydropteridine diphosphokinase
MFLVYLLLGSNIGNKEKNLKMARKQIAERIGEVKKMSSIYETEAWGFTENTAKFLNQGLLVFTSFKPTTLLDNLLSIETELGRIRTQAHYYEPRTIDIDILFFEDKVIETKRLEIPHPGIPERRFTLDILFEMAPDFVHPKLNKNIKQLREECADDKKVWRV